jgi:hypothetical protein
MTMTLHDPPFWRRSLLAASFACVVGFGACAPADPIDDPDSTPAVTMTPLAVPSPTPKAGPTATPGLTPTSTPDRSAATTASPTPSPPPTPTTTPTFESAAFPQTWSGTWAAPAAGAGGSLELVLTRGGATAEGTLTIDGTACLASGVVDGAVGGGQILFSISQRGVTFAFSGTTTGPVMEGRFSADCDDLAGTWSLARTG